MDSVSGKIAVVTGGGKGLGKAMALLFAQRGMNVVIPDVDVGSAQSVVSEIVALGRKGLAIEADVSSVADVDRIFDRTLETFGRVDVLVNNAGVSHPGVSIIDLDLEHLDRVFNVNYKGVYLCLRRGGREMARQKSGSIINISSGGGVVPIPTVIYSSLKAAIIMLTKVVARDFARFGVRVNSIAPGWVLTPLLKDYIDRGLRDPSKILNYTPMHTFTTPEDVAHVALFLASEEACHVTGSNYVVDAGFAVEGGWPAYPPYPDLKEPSKS